ncbi:MAG: hypothetical protein ABIT20_13850 [Gemmatimonadaceae bacterium]
MTSLERVVDPVCGMLIEPQHAAGLRVHREMSYYLCSPRCLAKFDGDADAYIAASRTEGFRPWVATVLTDVNSAPRAEGAPEVES